MGKTFKDRRKQYTDEEYKNYKKRFKKNRNKENKPIKELMI